MQLVGDRGDARAILGDGGGGVELLVAAAQHPLRGALEQPSGLDEHLGLRARGDLVVERLDVLP